MMKHITKSATETLELGFEFGKTLEKGSVVALTGELGTGKTVFTKGIAKALGIKDYIHVNSASFVILQEYKGKIPLYHFDLYRMKKPRDVETVGCEEYFYSKGISVVEWADRAAEILPEEHIAVEFKHKGGDKREITVNEKPKI